jgi:hypothetical protein
VPTSSALSALAPPVPVSITGEMTVADQEYENRAAPLLLSSLAVESWYPVKLDHRTVVKKIAEIEKKPHAVGAFNPSRYPYTYAYDYLRVHAKEFGLPPGMSRSGCSRLFRSESDVVDPDKEAICISLANA